MNDTKTERLCTAGDASADASVDTAVDAQLSREVSALLAGKGGVDESKAKHLRKRWDARQRQGAADESLATQFLQLRERVHAQVELRERQFAEVEDKLTRLRACLENGDIKQSQQLEQSAIDQLNRITGLSSRRRQRIITDLEALRPKLRKLTAWRHWGTVRAREKVIEEIKNIHDSGAALPQIAQRIRQVRKEWQHWDAAGEGGDKKLYEIFDRACTEAYQPCRAYFDRQKQKRRQNSSAREEICALLEREFERVEWRDPPWKELQQLTRDRAREWRRSGPADYALRKPLQRRFDAIMEKFDERLDRERRRCRKIREQLIADIEQLAERPDTGAALVELKALKKQWAPTVPDSRAKEQALWKRFTESCDKVYAKRAREREDFTRTLKQNLKAKEALCAEIEAGCRPGAEDPAALRANLGRWEGRWTQSGEAPKGAAKKINARYRRAMAEAQKTLAGADADQAMRLQDLLRQKALVCADIEALALAGAPVSEKKYKALTGAWAALAPLPDALEEAIGARYRLAVAAVTEADALRRLKDGLEANLETLHELLLQLEILLELDSPPAFSRQRMALQVGRLSAAMGKADTGEGKSAERLIREILLVGAVDEGRGGAAFKRLDHCLVKQAEHQNHHHQKHHRHDAAGL